MDKPDEEELKIESLMSREEYVNSYMTLSEEDKAGELYDMLRLIMKVAKEGSKSMASVMAEIIIQVKTGELKHEPGAMRKKESNNG